MESAVLEEWFFSLFHTYLSSVYTLYIRWKRRAIDHNVARIRNSRKPHRDAFHKRSDQNVVAKANKKQQWDKIYRTFSSVYVYTHTHKQYTYAIIKQCCSYHVYGVHYNIAEKVSTTKKMRINEQHFDVLIKLFLFFLFVFSSPLPFLLILVARFFMRGLHAFKYTDIDEYIRNASCRFWDSLMKIFILCVQ